MNALGTPRSRLFCICIGLLALLGACGKKAVPSYSGVVLQVPAEGAWELQRPLPAAFIHLRWTDDGVFDIHPNGQCVHSELTTTGETGWFSTEPWIYKGGTKRKLRFEQPSVFAYAPGFTPLAQLPAIHSGKDSWLKVDTGSPTERLEHIGWSIDHLNLLRCPNGARILAPLYARIAQEVRDLQLHDPEKAQLLLDRIQQGQANATMDAAR